MILKGQYRLISFRLLLHCLSKKQVRTYIQIITMFHGGNFHNGREKMKYSAYINNHNETFREGRQSQISFQGEDSSFSLRKCNIGAYRSPDRTKQLKNSSRLSRRQTSNNKIIDKHSSKPNIAKLVADLKSQYAQQARLSEYSNFVKTKSEQSFLTSLPKKPQGVKKSKSPIQELQEKISQYSQHSKLASVKSATNLLQQSKTPQRNLKLSQKTEKCRQLCLQIKRKLFKQTVSTTNTQSPRKPLSISDFKLQKLLGEGKFSKVYIARHKKTGMILAIKVIKKQTIQRENFLEQLIRQIKIQSFFNHVNIVKIYSFFHDKLNVYLLLEYCSGGQLYDIFKIKSKLKEDEWQPIMKGVCEGLLELHRYSVIHRDLKPQNIVLSFGLPKIGDFGWSVNNQDKRQTFCGTPLYISPQLLLGNSYGQQIDIWALGVMMYQFLTGRIPFKIQHEKNLLQIVNAHIVYPKFLSEDCLDLLKMILEKDPSSRIAILDILQHPFMKKNFQNSSKNFHLFKYSR